MKANYVEVEVSAHSGSLCGYLVVGDFVDVSESVDPSPRQRLLLKRPEQTTKRKPKAKSVSSRAAKPEAQQAAV